MALICYQERLNGDGGDLTTKVKEIYLIALKLKFKAIKRLLNERRLDWRKEAQYSMGLNARSVKQNGI